MNNSIAIAPTPRESIEELASLIDAQLLLADLQSGLRPRSGGSGWVSWVRPNAARDDTLAAIARCLARHPDLVPSVLRLRSALDASESRLPAPWWTARFASALETHAQLERLVTAVTDRIRDTPGHGWRPLEGVNSRREPKKPRRLSHRRQRVAAG